MVLRWIFDDDDTKLLQERDGRAMEELSSTVLHARMTFVDASHWNCELE